MSKQGVQQTQEQRKPRRRVQLEERNGDVGKECTKCGEWKVLDDYHRDKGSLGDRTSHCKFCRNKSDAIVNKVHVSVNDGVLGKVCTQCEEWVALTGFCQDKRISGGRRSNCKKCQAKYRVDNRERHTKYFSEWCRKNKSYFSEWRRNNPEHQAEYRKANRNIYNSAKQRYRARKDALPDNLYKETYEPTLRYFGNACAITGQTENLEMEHALPISIGHGGTTFGNCYPMANGFNQSKGNSSIFEWFASTRQRRKLSQSRFDALIGYLARANALTVSEYHDFYYWCFANPRTVDEIKADQRHSLEIWREASSQQFPLPAYTETYNFASTDESEAV